MICSIALSGIVLRSTCPKAPLFCAGAARRPLIKTSVRELPMPRRSMSLMRLPLPPATGWTMLCDELAVFIESCSFRNVFTSTELISSMVSLLKM